MEKKFKKFDQHKIYTKDRKDFLKFYEKASYHNELKERIFWKENSIDPTKVDIKIIAACYAEDVLKELKKIED